MARRHSKNARANDHHIVAWYYQKAPPKLERPFAQPRPKAALDIAKAALDEERHLLKPVRPGGR